MTKENNTIKIVSQRGYTVDKKGNLYNPQNKEFKSSVTKGYITSSIRINKKPSTFRLHRLVAYFKYGEKLFSADCVRHLDGNSLNNSWDNIVIGTDSENMMDVPKEIRVKKASLAGKIHNHKTIISDHKNGLSYAEIMQKYNISSKGTISFIINKSLDSTV